MLNLDQFRETQREYLVSFANWTGYNFYMKNKNKGFLVSVLVIIIAIFGIGWWMSAHKDTSPDMEVKTPTQDPVPVVKTEVKNTSKTTSFGDLSFDYSSDTYTIQDRGVTSDGLKQITLHNKTTAQSDIHISMRKIEREMQGYISEESLRLENVQGGVAFKKINNNGLTTYQSTIQFEVNTYVLQYVIIYNGSLYTFTVTPTKPQSKIAELETNRKSFENILNSIRPNK